MTSSSRSLSCIPQMGWIAVALLCGPVSVRGQAPACPAVEARPATPAATAYSDARYADAEGLYRQALAQSPQDPELSAALVRTLLHEDKVSQASSQASTALAANPHAASALTAEAEVELRQGQPWLAKEALDAVIAAEPCYARAHLIRSRALRIDSMYASERVEIQKAYDIDPTDPDIQNAWQRVVSPAQEIEGVEQGLQTTKNVDPDIRKRAEDTVHSLMPLLSENSQTCQILPTVPSATLPMEPAFADVKHIDGYRLEAEFPVSKAKLIVDTAASGVYISKALAQQNGLQQGADDPPGTVRVDTVRIGPLEFHNCLVGVSDAPFAGKADGFIGTDMFAQWMVTLNYRLARLSLAPLPPQTGLLPPDRSTSPELAGFTPVYHRRQYLLVPLRFGNQSRKLFILATGMRFSAMTSEAAHSLSRMTVNFTNTEQTAQGTRVQFYREVFDFQLANLQQIHQGHILELDPSVMERNAGFEIAGMLGLDVLQPLTLQLDYRDGLVKFESTEEGVKPLFGRETTIASNSSAPASPAEQATCEPGDAIARPLNQTIEARTTGGFDSAHLKPGKGIYLRVISGYVYPGCTLDEDAILYGHVTAATTLKNSSESELSVVFDHADCAGHENKPVTLRLIGLVGPPEESERLHDALPVELAGGGRSITTAVQGLVNVYDMNLNPGGPPGTVQPGVVINMPAVKLLPEGGPGCSAKITSTNHSVTVGTGSELLLSMEILQ
ncbi:MAG TPA: aspartyl protease family protein [Terracidiphilus sp.]|nr:aspartyl protease family protein [Terracidiphilus sp.]